MTPASIKPISEATTVVAISATPAALRSAIRLSLSKRARSTSVGSAAWLREAPTALIACVLLVVVAGSHIRFARSAPSRARVLTGFAPWVTHEPGAGDGSRTARSYRAPAGRQPRGARDARSTVHRGSARTTARPPRRSRWHLGAAGPAVARS